MSSSTSSYRKPEESHSLTFNVSNPSMIEARFDRGVLRVFLYLPPNPKISVPHTLKWYSGPDSNSWYNAAEFKEAMCRGLISFPDASLKETIEQLWKPCFQQIYLYLEKWQDYYPGIEREREIAGILWFEGKHCELSYYKVAGYLVEGVLTYYGDGQLALVYQGDDSHRRFLSPLWGEGYKRQLSSNGLNGGKPITLYLEDNL